MVHRIKDWFGFSKKPTPNSTRQKVKDEYNTENGKLVELARKKAELSGNLGNDFGAEDVFLTLIDRLVKTSVLYP